MNKYFAWIFVLMTSLSLSAFADHEEFKNDEADTEEVAVETDADVDTDSDDSGEVAAAEEEVTE